MTDAMNNADERYWDYCFYRDELKCFAQKCGPIYEALDAALGAYMAALDDPQGKSEALTRFDAGLVRLREIHREGGWDWERWGAGPPHLFRSEFF